MADQCDGCVCFVAENPERGTCCYAPPVPTGEFHKLKSEWPKVLSTDLCSLFSPGAHAGTTCSFCLNYSPFPGGGENLVSAQVVSRQIELFAIEAGVNDRVNIDIDNAGVVEYVLTQISYTAETLATELNAADPSWNGAFSAASGRLIITSFTAGPTGEIDIQAPTQDSAYNELGLVIGVYIGTVDPLGADAFCKAIPPTPVGEYRDDLSPWPRVAATDLTCCICFAPDFP